MVNRIGNYTLFRYKVGSRTLKLREDGYSDYAPRLHGWECFFVGRHPTFTNWSYRRAAR